MRSDPADVASILDRLARGDQKSFTAEVCRWIASTAERFQDDEMADVALALASEVSEGGSSLLRELLGPELPRRALNQRLLRGRRIVFERVNRRGARREHRPD